MLNYFYKKLNIPRPTNDWRNLKYYTTFLYLNSEEIIRADINLNINGFTE